MIAAVKPLARQNMWSPTNYFSKPYPLSYPSVSKSRHP